MWLCIMEKRKYLIWLDSYNEMLFWWYNSLRYNNSRKMCVIKLIIAHTITNMKRHIRTDYKNMSLHICNGMGYNQHYYTHLYRTIRSEWVISSKKKSLYEYNIIRYLLFSIMHSKIPQLISCLEPFKKTRPGLSRNPCTP